MFKSFKVCKFAPTFLLAHKDFLLALFAVRLNLYNIFLTVDTCTLTSTVTSVTHRFCVIILGVSGDVFLHQNVCSSVELALTGSPE